MSGDPWSPGALEILERSIPAAITEPDDRIAWRRNLAANLLCRHCRLEPGTLCRDDQEANREALETGARVFSSFLVGSERLWIITEAADDHGRRAATTILRPDEY